jgi:hypothetical protein
MGVTHLSGLEVAGVPTMGMSGLPLTTGNVFFVDYVNGGDGNSGAADAPLKTLYMAQVRMTAGQNDVAVIVGDGSTTATQRLSLANAQIADSTATTGTLVWAKAACHIVGMAAPTAFAARARLAPPTGTYTATTFNADVFVSVTAQGCIFSNISTYVGFSTGSASMVGWSDTGGRNYYSNVQFGGFGDAASAQGTGARALLVSGSTGENTFDGCVIGLDTTARTVANASLEFAAGTPRNVFRNCVFPMLATNAGVLSILGTGASCMDRDQIFDRCKFVNAMSSGGTAQTVIASMTNASPGGLLLMDNCVFIGDSSTNWGDTNALANMYVNGGSPTAATNGNAVKPT